MPSRPPSSSWRASQVPSGAVTARGGEVGGWAAQGVLSATLVRRVARTALDLATNRVPAHPAEAAAQLAAGLETGVLRSMIIPKVKIVFTVVLALAMALASA